MRKSWERYKQLHQALYGEQTTREAELSKIIDIMTYTESMIREALASALKEYDSGRSIYEVLAYIGKSTGSDRAYLFETVKDYVVNTYEWCGEGVSAEKENLQQVPWEDLSVWRNAFEKGENIIISNIDDIKESDPVVYDYLTPQNIKSVVVSPLIVEGNIIGFYGVDNPPGEMLQYVSDMSWIVAYFLVAMVKQRDMVKHLERLSYYDQLTGLRNRHALYDFIRQGKFTKNVGIIYCDVMNLKKVNDQLGHEAGDALLVRAGSCLRRFFRDTDVFRMGGDEFLVICGNMDKNLFYHRIDLIRKDMQECNALMALGSMWEETLKNVEEAIARADNIMYKEKQEYHRING